MSLRLYLILKNNLKLYAAAATILIIIISFFPTVTTHADADTDEVALTELLETLRLHLTLLQQLQELTLQLRELENSTGETSVAFDTLAPIPNTYSRAVAVYQTPYAGTKTIQDTHSVLKNMPIRFSQPDSDAERLLVILTAYNPMNWILLGETSHIAEVVFIGNQQQQIAPLNHSSDFPIRDLTFTNTRRNYFELYNDINYTDTNTDAFFSETSYNLTQYQEFIQTTFGFTPAEMVGINLVEALDVDPL